MKKNIVINKSLKPVITILFICLSVMSFAQKNKRKADTTAVIKEFITVCNQYKKLPLRLTVQHSNSATIGVSPEDTANTRADFYMTEQGTYIKYGNVEQVVSDSLMLLISADKQVMMLYPTTQNTKTQLNSYLGLQMGESSVLKTAAAYTSAFLPGANDNQGIIELNNRLPLPGTDIAKEMITLKYNIKSKEPEQVIYIRRTLVPVNKAEWDSLPGRENMNGQLVTIKDRYFLINERRQIFDYKEISHSDEIKLPVRVDDRIVRNQQGGFTPAKGFEDYYLSVE